MCHNNYVCTYYTTYSVFKETMKAGGDNVTKVHAEDVSLSAIFYGCFKGRL